MNRYALVIGISEYSSNRLQSLPKAASDAESLAQLLEEHGNFQVERIPKRWDNTKNRFEVAAKPVTKEQIIKELRTLLWERAVNSEALIYFAGHGLLVFDELDEVQGFLAASDTQIENRGEILVKERNAISLELLNRLIQKASVSNLVMLLDCCHSGSFLESDSLRHTLTSFSAQKDYYLIAACRSFETARAYKHEAHSIFSGAIIQGLDTTNADSKGKISCDSLFDYTQRKLQDSGQEPIRMGGGRSITLVTHKLVDIIPAEVEFNHENPYLGLHAFEPENESYFYGRDVAIRALLDRISKGRFLSVIGASGCGKSSLVKAGLLPRLYSEPILDSDKCEIAQLTPGTNPLDILIDKLTPLHHLNQPFVLFIDQFEEVFTLCKNDSQRRAFFRLLAEEAKTNERQGRLIVAVRGDFLDRCAEYTEIADLINSTQPTTYFVEPLCAKELEVAIIEPAKLHGVSFEPGLVSQMIEDVIRQPGALPLLQYALWELWRVCIEKEENQQPRLTWQGYNYIGKVGGALDTQASLLYQSFPSDAHKAFVQRLFLELVKLGEEGTVTRRRATRETLASKADSPEQLEQVLGRLVKRRLLVITTQKKGENSFVTYVEVAHESLLTKWQLLQDWIDQNRDHLRIKDRFKLAFQLWRDTYHKSDDALLEQLWLTSVVDWQQKAHPRLTAEEEEFITMSVTKHDRALQEQLAQERRLKELAEAKAEAAGAKVKIQKQRTWLASATGLLVAFIFGLLLLLNKIQEARERKAIEIGFSVFEAQQIAQKPDQLEALIKSVQVLKAIDELGGDNSEVLKQIQSFIYEVRERNRLIGHTAEVNGVSLHPQSKLIVTADGDRKIKLWNLEGELKKTFPDSEGHKDVIWNVKFSPDGQMIASSSLDKTVKIWNLRGEVLHNLAGDSGHQQTVYGLSFSSDSQLLASSSRDGTIKIWNTQTGSLKRTLKNKNFLEQQDYRVYSVDFNPSDTNRIASSGYFDGNVNIWNLKSNQNDTPIVLKEKHKEIVSAVKFSPNGYLIASAGFDGIIKLWRVEGREFLGMIELPTKQITDLAFTDDSSVIASTHQDGTIKLWKVDEVIRQWNLNETSLKIPYKTLTGHSNVVNQVNLFSPNEEELIIISSSDDKTVKMWQVDTDAIKNKASKSNNVPNLNDLLNYSCDALSSYLKVNENPEVHQLCDSYGFSMESNIDWAK